MSKAERYIELVSDENGHLCDQHALRAVEIAKKEMIEKAIKWVEYNNENGGCKFDGWVENIKQAMKDE